VSVLIISDSLYEKRIVAPHKDIMKRKRTEKALEDTENKLKDALEMYWGKWIRRNFEDCSTILR
jgi:hypothetical protein